MQTGRTNSLNYNSGTFGAPTWVAIGRASSPSRTQGRPTSRKVYREATTSKNATGILDYGISGSYVARTAGDADTVLDALTDSLLNETVLDIAMLDQAASVTGAKGIRGPFVVTQLDRSEDDEDAVTYEFTLSEVESADQETDEFTIA